jgi:hypothetical protein
MEERGEQMFDAGKSERQVARALNVGNGTAHRLRMRIAAKREGGKQPVQEVAAVAAPVGAIGDLEARRAKLARELEELDALLSEAHHKELADALDAVSMVSPQWPPLAALWSYVARELGELSRTL